MKVSVLLRQIHNWASVIVLVPLGIMIIAGILLMLKKDIDWIQPPTQRAETFAIAADISLDDLYAAALAIPELETEDWRDFDRVDVRADRGIVKFVAANRWEAQIDLNTLETVQLAYRRSDLIEQIHDGSFFADWVKLFVFLPIGVVLLFMWGSGIYLFFYPHVKRMQRNRKRRALPDEN